MFMDMASNNIYIARKGKIVNLTAVILEDIEMTI